MGADPMGKQGKSTLSRGVNATLRSPPPRWLIAIIALGTLLTARGAAIVFGDEGKNTDICEQIGQIALSL